MVTRSRIDSRVRGQTGDEFIQMICPFRRFEQSIRKYSEMLSFVLCSKISAYENITVLYSVAVTSMRRHEYGPFGRVSRRVETAPLTTTSGDCIRANKTLGYDIKIDD